MIEIKQSRKLHPSGFRLMQITNVDRESGSEIINEACDVLHLGFNNNWLHDLRIDITKSGIIRIFSDDFELVPDKWFAGSDATFYVVPRRK